MGIVRLVVIKKNKKTLSPYPVQMDFNCEKMSEVVSIPSGGASMFIYYRPGKDSIPDTYQVEQTISQIKALCNHCCGSTSA